MATAQLMKLLKKITPYRILKCENGQVLESAKQARHLPFQELVFDWIKAAGKRLEAAIFGLALEQ